MKKTTTPTTTTPVEEAWDLEPPTPNLEIQEPQYDLEGLMTDFPTARDLEKFVFDQTGYALNLKGRSNKFKYSTALDILNGQEPRPELLSAENPYLDRNDLVPVDTMKTLPPRPEEIQREYVVTQFQSNVFPHPDDEWKSSGQKCSVIFRKYTNNAITYEIIGPVSTRPVGERINKFGKVVPEKYEWVDPRTGEQIIRHANGNFSSIGTRLRAYMQRQKVNKTTAWDAWIDREFIIIDGNSNMLDNPWSI